MDAGQLCFGGLLYANDSSGTYYPVYDGNGNIMVYVNNSGTKVAEYAYDPFGKIISLSGTKVNDFMFRFSTKYFDKETGFYYYGFRYYSPKLGRWISRDPIEEEGGWNLYCMVVNNPLNIIDLLGHGFWDWITGGGVGAGGSTKDYSKLLTEAKKTERNTRSLADRIKDLWKGATKELGRDKEKDKNDEKDKLEKEIQKMTSEDLDETEKDNNKDNKDSEPLLIPCQ